MNLPALNWPAIFPEVVIILTAFVVLLAELAHGLSSADEGGRSRLAALVTLVGLIVAAIVTVLAIGQPAADFQGMVLADDLSRYLNLVVLLAAILGVLTAWQYLPRFTQSFSEFYSLLLLAVAGMMFLGKAVELITLFVSLEILSVSLYILVGFHRGQLASAEAALKYFLLGAFASSFVIYGAALLYADTGSTFLSDIAATSTGGFFTLAAMGLLLVGFGFKVAAFPFHMWTPDAYQGAPTPVTSFMSVATKAAAFVALFRVLHAVGGVPYASWSLALAIMAVVTMTVGNLAALRQRSLKRMLAYSSIAQAGYMLIGLVAGTADGLRALMFYLFSYAFMNLGAFAVASLLEGDKPGDKQDADIDAADGLFSRKPLLAVAMAAFMLSLAGIPPLAGFFGKLYLFSAAVSGGWTWLAVAGVINSVISAYYYLRVTVAMFMKEPSPESRLQLPLPDSVVLAIVISVLGVFLLGLFASPWVQSLGQIAVVGGR